jgi:hypothetical protein
VRQAWLVSGGPCGLAADGSERAAEVTVRDDSDPGGRATRPLPSDKRQQAHYSAGSPVSGDANHRVSDVSWTSGSTCGAVSCPAVY